MVAVTLLFKKQLYVSFFKLIIWLKHIIENTKKAPSFIFLFSFIIIEHFKTFCLPDVNGKKIKSFILVQCNIVCLSQGNALKLNEILWVVRMLFSIWSWAHVFADWLHLAGLLYRAHQSCCLVCALSAPCVVPFCLAFVPLFCGSAACASISHIYGPLCNVFHFKRKRHKKKLQ